MAAGRDPDLQLLSEISGRILEDYFDPEADPWAGSPFAWILSRPSRQKGAIGERLVSEFAIRKGLSVRNSPDTDADRIIEGRRVEIKFSSLWKSGEYVFQQFRDQNYETAVCLGISPFAASCWVIPKPELLGEPLRAGLSHQHGGARGSDTIWLRLDASRPPAWLAPYGGTLESAMRLLLRIGSFAVPRNAC